MTRISRKLLSCILGAIACIALVFGVLVSRPQTKVASADTTAVTFNAAALGDDPKPPSGTYSIRFDTQGKTFAPETYYNWVAASEYKSIADYTTVNGRTVTEINNANPGKQPITLMMQEAGTFSFLRLYIPTEIMPLDEVKSMGILNGWSFIDSKNGGTTYTSSAVTFLRMGDTMVASSSYNELNKVTPTIGEAVSGYRTGESLGGDSWVVSIDLGTGAVYTEFDLMYNGYKTLRNAIYINGKSIDEWNTQAIEKNPAFGDPSTYLVFPQNSDLTEYPAHKDVFIKPVGLWGNETDDVVKLTILKGLVADAEEIVVTVGTGACVPGQFMVGETVSKVVHTQGTKNITNDIACMSNTIDASANYAVYYIYTGYSEGNEPWTANAMNGGCLGENDVTGKNGGHSLLKYVYFNGTSVWDINKAIDETYGSTHGNIANGGVYAPIFATLSTEVGGALKLHIPLNFAGLDENGAGIVATGTPVQDNHREIVLKRGLTIYDPTTGISSYVTNDIVYTNTTEGAADNTRWTKEIKSNDMATEVTGILTYAKRTDGGNNENFVIFQLSNNDYRGLDTAEISDISSLYGYIDIGGTVINSYTGQKFFNVWGIENSVAFRFADYATLQNVPYITIKAGAKFPAYTTQTSGVLTYYVTQEDVTFIHNVPNDTWTVGALSKDTSVTAISVSSNTVSVTLSVSDYKETQTNGTPVVSGLNGYFSYYAGSTVDASDFEFVSFGGDDQISFSFGPISPGEIRKLTSITIKAGAKFPSATSDKKFYVTTEDVTFNKNGSTWEKVEDTPQEPELVEVDVTSELSFHLQVQQFVGTETYLLRTQNNYWTKAPQGGCLNEHDAEGAGGGQEQMKYLYFNGTSLYDINKNDNDSYNSEQSNIASGGIYAPILVTMGSDQNIYSYIQIHVPTEYADGNHQKFSIKNGFSVTEGDKTYVVTKDITWVNVDGEWKNLEDPSLFDASTVTIGNPRREGVANELYKIDIESNQWSITCNNYDFMYGGKYDEYRKKIFINDVSVYDINANTDDSAYTYSTFPMTGADDATFAKPIIVETDSNNGQKPTNKITLWIHEEYMKTLGDEVIVTLGAGYSAFTNGKYLAENVDYDMFVTVTIDGVEQTVFNGGVAKEPSTDKPMTETTIYEFDGWYIAGTDTPFDFNTQITEDISIESRYNEISVQLIETAISDVYYYVAENNDNDRWLIFYLSEHDYPSEQNTIDIIGFYDTLKEWGTFDKIILKGEMTVGGVAKEEATLQELFNANGKGEAFFLNIWNNTYYNGTLAVRANGVTLINEIVIEDGCFFPSYEYISGNITMDTRYAVMKPQTFSSEKGTGMMSESTHDYDIQMADGASVRIKDIPYDFTGEPTATAANETSGIRFETKISVADLDKLLVKLQSGEYTSVSFGTLIVTTSDLMGGQFTHAWLKANGVHYKDIACTAGFYQVDGKWTYAFPDGDTQYQSFFGSLVRLKPENYTRWFSGLGYIQIETKDGDIIYTYAHYDATNSRSIAHVAQATYCDRSETQTAVYKYKISDTSYSPYTAGVNNFINAYINAYKQTMTDMGVAAKTLDKLTAPCGNTLNPTAQEEININKDNQKLAGAYVVLQYSTNVNLRGKFYYQNGDGTKKAVEDFYLQAGTTEHKQFLDIYRKNGVGYGLSSDKLYMTKIELANVEFTNAVAGKVKILGVYSMDREIPVTAQEIYLTVAQNDGSEMTVGAHLGLGGGLTYLAKSGIYEGLTGSIFSKKVAIKQGTSDFSDYYGSATSSKASDGAVNLINNYDAGRQIQQSWYAAVGGDSTGTANQNGYTRAFCKTETSSGKYWPYNPVQAGDVVSNPSQIIDYEVNETKGYIYVKARAMDWAKGRKSSDVLENTIEGGSTTKSYVENYYRLNQDGTLYVNNAFVDWNGFTDMETCDWASTELPAVYPVHTLNYYVSNLDGDGTWEDGLEYTSGLGSWTNEDARCLQLTTPQPSNGYLDTKVEEWFAWANGGDENAFALGMYIPNVDRFTSGRSTKSTNQYASGNNNSSSNILKSKGLMSNMQEIKKSYQSAYVGNTSYTAPGINFRMEAYKSIEYTYVIALGSVTNIRNTFKDIKDNATVTNAGNGYEKVGLDAWARADKQWTW